MDDDHFQYYERCASGWGWAGERLAATLATIHNEHFIIKLVDDIRESILTETFNDFKLSWLARYYGK